MSSKKYIPHIVISAIILLGVLFYFYNSQPSDVYSFHDDQFSYSQNRPTPQYQMSLINETDTLEIYKIKFQSRNFTKYETTIYGLLILPKNKNHLPGLVYLPAGGMGKETRLPLLKKLANNGYAILVIDQRGIGETSGHYLSLQDDYGVFTQGLEPVQHLSVYDALKSFDILKEIKFIDKKNIALAGESMGGRYAIIATALNKNIKGALIISSAGYDVQKDPTVPYNSFLLSIDPDKYISQISPRFIAFFQAVNDTIVPPATAKQTFTLAQQPKDFFIYDNSSCHHGYCPAMYHDLENSLKKIFGK